MAESKFCACCLRGDENNTGEAWCYDCGELVCKTCSSSHKKLSPPHKVVPMEKISSLSSSLLTLSRNCEFHNDQETVLFCCQHDKLICTSCFPESHQNCKPVISIEMAAKDTHKGTTVADLEKRMDNITQIMETILSIYCTQISSLDERTKDFKQAVTDIRRNIISHLDKLEADFNKEIDSKYKECSETFMKNKSEIQHKYDTLTTWRNDMESLKNYTSNVQLFHVIKYLDAKTHREETEFRNLQTNATMPILNFRPVRQIPKMHDILPSFGALSLDNITIPTSQDLDIDQQGQTFVRSEVQKVQIPLVNSFEKSKLGDGVTIYRCCFVPDNKLLLISEDEYKIYLCDHDGSNTKTINLDYYPCGVTLYDRNTALVSAGDKGIQIIDLQTLKPGKLIKVGRSCRGITSLNGKIWMRSDKCTLTLVDIIGKVQKKVTTSFDPYEICLTKDGDIYCTDRDSDDVYLIKSDGEECVVYSSPDLTRPIGITVDDYGDVYIAGRYSDNIHRISSDGQLSNIILTEEDGMHKPTGLSFNNHTKELMVENDIYKCINIYKVS